jgi:hypothetical protein
MTRPTVDCPYCDRQCIDEQLLALHKGHEHSEHLTETEETAFENARASEQDALRRHQLKALLLVTTLYFGFLFAFRIVG